MPRSHRRTDSHLRASLPLATAVLAGLGLAGCSSLRPTQQAFAPDEYNMRHPIKLAESSRHIDIFENGVRLDRRQHQDVIEFGREFAQSGHGVIHAAIPANYHGGSNMAGIRAALAEAGVRAPIQTTSYNADPGRGAAPIRLSFVRLQAKIDSQCGLWPADLAGVQKAESWHNRPYHNLGCSYQSMLAAQVADPIDFVRPRAEGPVDTVKRTKDIEALRKDTDPSTNWRKDDAKIKEAQQ